MTEVNNMEYLVEKQHKQGKLHAIERINRLVDNGSFHEIGQAVINYREDMFGHTLPYDGVITGYGTINGKRVYVYAQDFTVNGGSLGYKHGEKIATILKKAIENMCPIIGINDSGGARIQEGVNSLKGYGDIFYYNVLASGYIPQISIIAGTCAGGAAYSPAITDFVFVIEGISNMYVTGPKVIKAVTGRDVLANELGGTEIHSKYSGVAHFIEKTEDDCYRDVRNLIDSIPQNNLYKYEIKRSKTFSKKSNIEKLLPKNKRRAYDIKNIIMRIVDDFSFIEIQEHFAANIVIGFGRIENVIVVIVANQPLIKAGVLDSDSSDKSARFIRYCDDFNIPLITLVDTPGFMPSIEEERKGIIRHGAKLIVAYAEATVPKITLILRKAYGGAYIAMCSRHLGADYVFCWPGAEIAVMGAEGAVNIIYKKELLLIDDIEKKKDFLLSKTKEYQEQYINAKIALEEGYIDAEITPSNTRDNFIAALSMLKNKSNTLGIRKKHSNIPL